MAATLEHSLKRAPESEFDSLAQQLLLNRAEETLSAELKAKIRSRPLTIPNHLVSRNWVALRGLCCFLKANLNQTDSAEQRRAGSNAFTVFEHQLPGGLFPDSPLGTACPVAYHGKMCATLGLTMLCCPREFEACYIPSLRRGLDALVASVSPTGILVPYGRSRNNLFGYASAYLAFRLGAYLLDCPHCSWGAEQVIHRLRQFQAPDGHIPAVLNDGEWMRQDWDVYINNLDYNAYAAGCLLLAEEVPPGPKAKEPQAGITDLGPFLVDRSGDHFFAISTTGEMAPLGTPFFSDFRYAGLQPLLWESGRHVMFFDHDYCWDARDSTRRALYDPRNHTWLPYFQNQDKCYWTPVYPAIHWSREAETLTLSGTGSCLHIRPTPAWKRLLFRLVSRPVPQIHAKASGYDLESTVTLNLQSGQLIKKSQALSGRLDLNRANIATQLPRN